MSHPPPGNILYARTDDVLCIRLEGRITFALGPAFADFIGQIFARPDVPGIVVDLTGAAAVDSTTLGLLAKIARLLRQHRGEALVVISGSERITATLRGLGLDRLMTIVEAAEAPAGDLKAMPLAHASKSDQTRAVLEAHRELMTLNEKNAVQFRTVVEFLEQEARE